MAATCGGWAHWGKLAGNGNENEMKRCSKRPSCCSEENGSCARLTLVVSLSACRRLAARDVAKTNAMPQRRVQDVLANMRLVWLTCSVHTRLLARAHLVPFPRQDGLPLPHCIGLRSWPASAIASLVTSPLSPHDNSSLSPRDPPHAPWPPCLVASLLSAPLLPLRCFFPLPPLLLLRCFLSPPVPRGAAPIQKKLGC